MGKTLKIAAALLLVCILVFTAATAFFIAASDDVQVFQKTLYGDPKAAEGLTVDFRVQYRSVLHWDIHCDPVTGESNTDFIFDHDDPFYVPYNSGPRGVEMYSLMDYRSHGSYWNMEYMQNTPEDSGLFKLAQHLQSLPPTGSVLDGNSTVAQEESCHTIDLSDFFEYYPFEGEVDLFQRGHIPSWYAYSEYSAPVYGSSKMLCQLFNGYFKIPVRDNAAVRVSIYEYRSGRRDYRFDGFPEDTSFFFPEIYNFSAGNGCYFAFSSTMSHDVSQIPGGWGIYRLDYTLQEKEQDIATASLSTVYPLDPAVQIRDMELSADGKTILLTTVQEDGTYLTVIELETMQALQEIPLYSGTLSPYIYVDVHEDFILVKCENREPNYQRLSVYQRLADGTYEQRIDVNPSAYPLGLDMYDDRVSFDGQRLALAQGLLRNFEEDGHTYSYPASGFTLQIFDSTGLLYCGEYSTTLESVNWDGIRYGEHNYPNYNAPFQLIWE